MLLELNSLYKKLDQFVSVVEKQGGGSFLSQDQINGLYEQITHANDSITNLNEEINNVFEMIKTCNDKYDEFYENSREAYVSFVNFSPSIKNFMAEVDKWLSQ